MSLPKINRAYQTRVVEVDAEPERTLPKKYRLVAKWYRWQRAVGVLPE